MASFNGGGKKTHNKCSKQSPLGSQIIHLNMCATKKDPMALVSSSSLLLAII